MPELLLKISSGRWVNLRPPPQGAVSIGAPHVSSPAAARRVMEAFFPALAAKSCSFLSPRSQKELGFTSRCGMPRFSGCCYPGERRRAQFALAVGTASCCSPHKVGTRANRSCLRGAGGEPKSSVPACPWGTAAARWLAGAQSLATGMGTCIPSLYPAVLLGVNVFPIKDPAEIWLKSRDIVDGPRGAPK